MVDENIVRLIGLIVFLCFVGYLLNGMMNGKYDVD